MLGLGLPGGRIGHLGQVPNLRELFWLARQLELVELRRDGLAAGPRLAPWQDGDGVDGARRDPAGVVARRPGSSSRRGREICDEAPRTGRSPVNRLTERVGERIPAIVVALYQAAALDQGQELAPLLTDVVDTLLGGVVAGACAGKRRNSSRASCASPSAPRWFD